MAAVLTNIGEEFVVKNAATGTFNILLFNDATDAASDTTDLANLSTEPSDGNYVRQTATFVAANEGGNWQSANDAEVSFDVTNTTGTVDAYAIVANFTSTEAGDGTATDHVILTGTMSQSRDLSQIDVLNFATGTVGVSFD